MLAVRYQHVVTLNTGLFSSVWEAIHPLVLVGINCVFIAGTSLLLLLMNSKFAIIRNRTSLSALFYILFLASDRQAFYSLTGNLTTLIILIALFQLYNCYQKNKVVEETFNVGVLLSVGSFFSTHLFYFIPIFWIGFSFFKADSLKPLLASVTGALTPYWFAFCWFLYINDLPAFVHPFTCLFNFDAGKLLGFELSDWVRTVFTILIALLAIGNFQLHNFQDKIRTRLIFYFLFTMLVITGILLILGILPFVNYNGVYYLICGMFAAHLFSTVYNRLMSIFFYAVLAIYLVLLFF
jgi:hypothetical protein